MARQPRIPNVQWVKGRAYGRKVHKGKILSASLDTTSPKTARERVRQWLSDLETTKWGTSQEKTFDDGVTLFVERHLPTKRPATRKRYLDSLIKLSEHLAGLSLDRITSKELAAYEAERLKTVTSATVRRDLAALSTLYSVAMEAHYCLHNPVLPYMRSAARRGLTDSAPKSRYLAHAEEERLLVALPRWLRVFVILAIDTGLRSAELTSLRWTEVDLTKNQIYVTPDKAKSKRGRWVPLLPRAKAALEEIPVLKGCPYVLHRDGQPITDVWHPFKAATASMTGLSDVTIHDLRRTCGCRLLQDHRLRMAEVSAWLGHSSVRVTERHYAFLGIDDLQRAVSTAQKETA